MLVEQFKRLGDRYDIDVNNSSVLEVWDNDLAKSIEFKFDKDGNLIEVW